MYYKKILPGARRRLVAKLTSIRAHPRKVAGAYALGFFLGTTPFVGLKVWIALLLASLLKWNRAAAVIGVYHINALTGPLFYSAAYFAGQQLLGTEAGFSMPESLSLGAVIHAFWGNRDTFMALLTGGLLLGAPGALMLYRFSYNLLQPQEERVGKEERSPYALITGASAGLGKELALELARRGANLILVALPGRNLDQLARQARRQFGVEIAVFEMDLTAPGAIEKLVRELRGRYPVNWLVNNAGMGGTAEMKAVSPLYIDRLLQLNVRATVLLTRLMLPELMRHRHSYILNVSSMAAFSPIAYKTVYPASKAFVYAFSRALREELRHTPVSVSVVHPGPILTNFSSSRRIIEQGALASLSLLPAREIATAAIAGTLAGKAAIIPGWGNKLNWLLMKALPTSWSIRLVSRAIRRELHADEKSGRRAELSEESPAFTNQALTSA
ncbi:MAG: SDR family NAD(P)-dependent oxidoreductase [Saprospiraceae bacterium]|nr:SDR family NAD(P)-dependent oxidoreductase [Saprospiraceae bacterium]